jgi:hypothetical protein
MSYGTLKVDSITYTSGGVDTNVTISGLVQGGFPNISITGTISGATITGNTVNATTITAVTGIFTSTLSGTTTTGVTANFQSGVFTTQISGTTVTGNSGQFTNVTGGGAGFTSVTGTTVTGTTANFVSGVFTTQISGATIAGPTHTGTTANFVSGVFTTQISGATIAGPTHTGTTADFVSGNFTGTLSGNTVRDNAGNLRDIPQVVQTTSYTLVAGDAGDHIFTTAGVTVPSGVFAVGQAVSIYNNTTGTITITQGTNVTLRQAGTSGTGNRTLAQRGLATVLCVSGSSGTEFVIGGNIS